MPPSGADARRAGRHRTRHHLRGLAAARRGWACRRSISSAIPDFLARRAERIAPGLPITVVEPAEAAADLPHRAAGRRYRRRGHRASRPSRRIERAGRDRRHPPRRRRRAGRRCRRGRHQSGRQERALPLGLRRAGPHRISRQARRGARPASRVHPVMMLWSPELAVVPVTIHLPLKDVVGRLTTDLIVETGRIVARDLRAPLRHRAAAAGGGRSQPACRRGRRARRGGHRHRRARGRSGCAPTASMRAARCRPTRCSTPPRARPTTRRSRCITTRR